MTPSHLDKIFEPLFTTKARGIGLGLAVSRSLVHANGGEISATSEEGRGSTLSIDLPAAQAKHDEPQHSDRRRRPTHGADLSPTSCGCRTGIPTVRTAVRRRSRPSATNAYQAVLMDVRMAGINGVDAFKAMKALRPEIKVILMTAYTAATSSRRRRERAPSKVLSKPVVLSGLLEMLEQTGKDAKPVLVVAEDADFSSSLRTC